LLTNFHHPLVFEESIIRQVAVALTKCIAGKMDWMGAVFVY